MELRDLKFRHQVGANGQPVLDINGKKIPMDRGREKGTDVLVALACVRAASRPEVDLVVLASHDTDLVPVLDELSGLWTANSENGARIEAVSWFERGFRSLGSLQPTPPRRLWNMNRGRACCEASLDRTEYL